MEVPFEGIPGLAGCAARAKYLRGLQPNLASKLGTREARGMKKDSGADTKTEDPSSFESCAHIRILLAKQHGTKLQSYPKGL